MQWKLTTQRRNQKAHRETSERLLCLHILHRLWKTVEDSIKNEKETMLVLQAAITSFFDPISAGSKQI